LSIKKTVSFYRPLIKISTKYSQQNVFYRDGSFLVTRIKGPRRVKTERVIDFFTLRVYRYTSEGYKLRFFSVSNEHQEQGAKARNSKLFPV
jgi:hypothetical protein